MFRTGSAKLQTRIDRLTFEGENAEHALMHMTARSTRHEALERFVSEREFAQCKIAFAAETAFAEANEVLRRVVLRP